MEIGTDRENMAEAAIRRMILHRIIIEGSFFISDISDLTGYSVTTVAKYVSRMVEMGEIYEMEKIALHERGRKTVKYGVNPDRMYFLGVDVRTFELNIGLIDMVGKVIRIETDSAFRQENTYDSLNKICDSVKKFVESIENVDFQKIAGMNINLPGRVNARTGTSATVFNFEETADTPLADLLSEKLGMPVFVENDTKAMAYGEYMSGLNKDYSDVCYVNMGWGLGLGLIFGGRLYYGKDGYSGEFGHVHMYDNNVLCHCGKKGCLETEVSGRAISRKLTERIKAGETSVLSGKIRSGEVITTADIIKAVEKEDALSIELVSTAGMELGHRIAGLINILNPEVIVIGGNFSQVESCYFLQYIKLAVRQYSLKLISQDVPIIPSVLGHDAAVMGACMIARAKVMDSMLCTI